MTSNFRIHKILKDHSNFMGCFHVRDLPPFPSKFPTKIIILVRGHWVSLYLKNEKECFYFDSFGGKIKNKKIIKYLYPHYSYIIFNSMKIQHNKSILCGLYCTSFIKCVHNYSNYKKFLRLFSSKDLLSKRM